MTIVNFVDKNADLSSRIRRPARSWRPGDPIQLKDDVDESDLLASVKDRSLRLRLLRRKMTAPEVTTITRVSPFDSAIERLKIVEKESGAEGCST